MGTAALPRTRHASLAAALMVAVPSMNPIERLTTTEAAGVPAHAQQVQTMKIRIDVDGTHVTATLDDNATSRDFVALLPLTLTLEDYNGTEKISTLSKKLSTADAPEGLDPAIGDITYYAPWGNLAIFYKDFPFSHGLVKLGRIDSGIEILETSEALRVTIRAADER